MTYNRKKIFILIPIAILLVLPFMVMLLWNNILVELLSLKTISYLQALGLFVLSRILFGSFGFGNRPKPTYAKQFFKEKLMNLSVDEKLSMKEEWKNRTEKSEKNLE
ncbi:MAG: hypothetical protein WAT89_10460 [Candidatus Kapaibacterium sp.]